jgi:hypothetical protein
MKELSSQDRDNGCLFQKPRAFSEREGEKMKILSDEQFRMFG